MEMRGRVLSSGPTPCHKPGQSGGAGVEMGVGKALSKEDVFLVS